MTGTTLRITRKNFHKLFLTARQKSKIRNAFGKHMSTNTKLSKKQMSKIIQLVGFLNKRLANVIDDLGKKSTNRFSCSFS